MMEATSDLSLATSERMYLSMGECDKCFEESVDLRVATLIQVHLSLGAAFHLSVLLVLRLVNVKCGSSLALLLSTHNRQMSASRFVAHFLTPPPQFCQEMGVFIQAWSFSSPCAPQKGRLCVIALSRIFQLIYISL